MRLAASLAAVTLLFATAANAADSDAFPFGEREYAIDEIAADLAYGFCPLYLAGQFPLTGNPELAQRGFAEEVRTTPNARFGELEQVLAIRPDGNIAFGGVPEQVCSVTVTDGDSDLVLARLHSDMSFMGLAFEPDPVNTGQRGVAMLETFKAPVEGQMLYLQIVRVSEPSAVVAQLFAMEE